MSDAKSAAEIEDILSSIRRLVTEDRKPAPASRPQVLSRLVVEDRLILTPAQRVQPKPESDLAFGKVTMLRRPEPKRAAQEVPEAPMLLDAPQEPDPAPLRLTEPDVRPRLHLDAAEAPADSLAWEAEMGDPAPAVSDLDWSSFTFARRPMAETYAARAEAAERLAPRAPEAVKAPVANGHASEAPVTPPVDAFILRKVDEPAAEAAPEAEPMGRVQEEDNIFSEEVLRELVRDLIREQLQGDLGERITRNIRKLVKAEIARSLTVRAAE